MIGDRIDKDIIPAKAIGMKTIRIRTGIHKNQEPRIPEEIPDITIERLGDVKMETIKAMDYCT
jgi:ribonucleotide monophosphatase NagD (HAD superfamily)